MTTFSLNLTNEELIVLTESLAMSYAGSFISSKLAPLEHGVSVGSAMDAIHCAMEDSLRTVLQSLLSASLQDRDFRTQLTNHFSTHALPMIQEIAWPWMKENLTLD